MPELQIVKSSPVSVDTVNTFKEYMGYATPLTLSKAKKTTTFKSIFDEINNYQFVCDNDIDIYSSPSNPNYVANIPTSKLPEYAKQHWNYLCTLLGIPVPKYCIQQFYDQYYCFQFAVVPKIVKYYSPESQSDSIGIKIGVDSKDGSSFIVPIEYQSTVDTSNVTEGKRPPTPLRYHVNGNKMSLRWIPLDEKVQKKFGAKGYFEVALIDKYRFCNFSFKINLDLETNEIATEEEFIEIWNEGLIVPYIKSSGNIIASFATVFSNLFANSKFPPTGIYFGVKNGTRDTTEFGTCWEIDVPPEFKSLEVVANKNGDIVEFSEISKLYITDSSPLSKFVPSQGVLNEKKVVCVYKPNGNNPLSYTPVHSVVTNVKAVAPIMKDVAEDYILSYMNDKYAEETKAMLNEGIQQGLDILQAKIQKNTEESQLASIEPDFLSDF